jgi:hypothetical protein
MEASQITKHSNLQQRGIDMAVEWFAVKAAESMKF